MPLETVPRGVTEGGNIGAESTLAAREWLPVIGKVGKIHADHQRSLVDVDETGLHPHASQCARRVDRAPHRAVARLGGRFVKCGSSIPHHALAGAPTPGNPKRRPPPMSSAAGWRGAF